MDPAAEREDRCDPTCPPPPSVHPLLEVDNRAENERRDPALASSQPASPQPVGETGAAIATTSASSRVRFPRRVTFLPASAEIVDSALHLVVDLARTVVGGADGVSVTLRRHGHFTTVAASDQTVRDMDAAQYATREGPCVDAATKGRWFHAGVLDTESRWPEFTPRARSLGIQSILSSPLLARERLVGALNIYSRTSVAFARRDQEIAAELARAVSILLTKAGADVTDERLASRLREAMRARRTIAQAEGVLMERGRIGEVAAYGELRRISVESGKTLRERAEEVVASTETVRPITSRGLLRQRHG
ncbi:MAG: ANTAR domain-containing protein [Acidimicrobiales bacterium]